ncbi:hypothetical protein SLE2022_315560 [Rubroshorea leprosula]
MDDGMTRKRKIQRSTVAEREIIQGGGLWTLALLVHSQNLQVLMVKRESKRSKSRSKRDKKRKHISRNKNLSSDNEDGGPVLVSRFFESVKS